MTDSNEVTPTEKAAEITMMISRGEQFTTAEIAERYSMTWQGADKLLNTISRRVPIYKDETKWRKL